MNNLLVDNSSAVGFTSLLYGENAKYSFTLSNNGAFDLELQSISLGGVNSEQFSLEQFSLEHPDISSSADLLPSDSISYTVTFAPSGSVSGEQHATINITSNDPYDGDFTFKISGLAFSESADVDTDGLGDWAEYLNAPLGFNWQITQTSLVDTYLSNSQASGLHRLDEIVDVSGGANIVELDSVTGIAKLVISLQESTDLPSFNPIEINAGDVSINSNGNLELELTAPEGKSFFRAEWE